MLNAKNGSVDIDGIAMDYICFGSGSKTLVMIPGLSDGLTDVKGKAFIIALSYREFAKDFTVYMFSRKRELPEAVTSQEMAADLAYALKKLGIEGAIILGVSQGGTIAQYLAIDYPELVKKLILTVTYPRANELVKTLIPRWIDFAKSNDYRSLFIDTTENTYSEKQLKIYRRLYPVLTKAGAPKSYKRFIAMANACITHDAYDRLCEIKCPTLILGGTDDKIVGGQASHELAELIPHSSIYMYEGLGHGAFDEASKDFKKRVTNFLKK